VQCHYVTCAALPCCSNLKPVSARRTVQGCDIGKFQGDARSRHGPRFELKPQQWQFCIDNQHLRFCRAWLRTGKHKVMNLHTTAQLLKAASSSMPDFDNSASRSNSESGSDVEDGGGGDFDDDDDEPAAFAELVRRSLPELVGRLVEQSQQDFSRPQHGALSAEERAAVAARYHDKLRDMQDARRSASARTTLILRRSVASVAQEEIDFEFCSGGHDEDGSLGDVLAPGNDGFRDSYGFAAGSGESNQNAAEGGVFVDCKNKGGGGMTVDCDSGAGGVVSVDCQRDAEGGADVTLNGTGPASGEKAADFLLHAAGLSGAVNGETPARRGEPETPARADDPEETEAGPSNNDEEFIGVAAVLLLLTMSEHIGRDAPRTASTFWFEYFGIYILRLGPLTLVDSNGQLVFSPIGVWLGTLGDDPKPYAGCYLSKYGVTSLSFYERFVRFRSELKAAGFPMECLDMVFTSAVIGLPRELAELLEGERVARNGFSLKGTRLRHFANAGQEDVNLPTPPKFRTRHSEMIEFIKDNDTSDTWHALTASANRLCEFWSMRTLSEDQRQEEVCRFRESVGKTLDKIAEKRKADDTRRSDTNRCLRGNCTNPRSTKRGGGTTPVLSASQGC
jgi:hypothetical protein